MSEDWVLLSRQKDELERRIGEISAILKENGISAERLEAMWNQDLFFKAPETIGSPEWNRVAQRLVEITEGASEAVVDQIRSIFNAPLYKGSA